MNQSEDIKDATDDRAVEQLRHAALQTSNTVLSLQRRAEEELLQAKKDLEVRAEELASSLSLLTATIESMVDGVIAMDSMGKIVVFNSKFAVIWNFPDELVQRRDSREMMEYSARQVKDSERFLALLRRRQSTPETESFDVVEMKDGRTFERYSSPHWVDQTCVGVVVTFREITRRKQVEAALQLSEEKYRLLWATAGDAFILFDHDNIIQEANAAVHAIFGYQPEELIGQELAVIQPERLREGHRQGIQRYLESGNRTLNWRAAQAIGLHKNGSEMPLEIAFNHLQLEGKNIFAGFIRDITDRKQVEQGLAVFEAIVDSSHDAIVSKTLDSTITSWNRGAELLFGYSATEAIGQSVLMLIPPERRNEEPQIIARQAQGERIDHFETVRVRKDGQRIDVSLTLSPIKDRDGKIVGVSKIARDITERKQAEAEREDLLAREQKARHEAEAADRTKDEFLATLSHELRTPLNAIVGWSSMMTNKLLSEEDKNQGLDIIYRNALLQARLVEDILDVSRIITGKLRLDMRLLDLSSVIENAVESVLPSAQAKEIHLQQVLDSGDSLVSGDSSRLQQVVWNLLSNAIKFTPKQGLVLVKLKRVDSHIEIQVLDSGEGISPEILPHVFERFRQADQSSTRSFGGLGLGLAIVRHIVESHGGVVEADSPGTGKGSTFTVKIPIASVRSLEVKPLISKDSPVSAPADQAESGNGTSTQFERPRELNNLHVLIVDDDEESRRLVKTVLESCGARVATAASAAEGLTTLQSSLPDVLLSDLGMPGEDGYSLIRSVRALPPDQGGSTPAAALTAFARVEDRLQVLRSGFQIHLPKPIEPVELIAVVANLARGVGG